MILLFWTPFLFSLSYIKITFLKNQSLSKTQLTDTIFGNSSISFLQITFAKKVAFPVDTYFPWTTCRGETFIFIYGGRMTYYQAKMVTYVCVYVFTHVCMYVIYIFETNNSEKIHASIGFEPERPAACICEYPLCESFFLIYTGLALFDTCGKNPTMERRPFSLFRTSRHTINVLNLVA